VAEPTTDRISVGFVPAETTWALRQEVLRPHRAVADCVYPGEDDPRAAHAAAVIAAGSPDRARPVVAGDVGAGPGRAEPGPTGDVVAVAAVMPEAPPWDTARPDGWRLRGMATRPDLRGQGVGGRVLDLLIGHVAQQGGGLLWCNARTPALHLYERAAFLPRGDVFELPEIGPHQVMWRMVAAAAPTPAPDGAAPP
jgi:GNAT superfamily N-acetyltransferase